MDEANLGHRQSEWFVIPVNKQFYLYPGTLIETDSVYFGVPVEKFAKVSNRIAAILLGMSRRGFRAERRRNRFTPVIFRVSATRFARLFTDSTGQTFIKRDRRQLVPLFQLNVLPASLTVEVMLCDGRA